MVYEFEKMEIESCGIIRPTMPRLCQNTFAIAMAERVKAERKASQRKPKAGQKRKR